VLWMSNVWNNFAPFSGYMLKGYEPHLAPRAPSVSAGPLTNRRKWRSARKTPQSDS
jgi:hypothetical protein